MESGAAAASIAKAKRQTNRRITLGYCEATRMTLRLLSASNALIPAPKFAIPAGYRKVDPASQP